MSTKLATYGVPGTVYSVSIAAAPPVYLNLEAQVIGPNQYFPPAPAYLPRASYNSGIITIVLQVQDQFGVPISLIGSTNNLLTFELPDLSIQNIPASFLNNGSDGNLTCSLPTSEFGYYSVYATCYFGAKSLTTIPVNFKVC